MQAAPGSSTGGRPLAGPHGRRKCREPLTVHGAPQLGRALRTGAGQEMGPGGHVVAPADDTRLKAVAAREAGECS